MTGETRIAFLIRQFLEIETRYLEWPGEDGKYEPRWRWGRKFGTRARFMWRADRGPNDMERLLLLTHRLLHALDHSQFAPPKNAYEEYMQSEEWDIRRRDALARAGYKCELCGANNERLNVHHWDYENLGNETEEDISVFCECCHQAMEGFTTPDEAGDGVVLSPAEVRARRAKRNVR
jgi:hypothetical protein